jgi:hypothetical protein
MKCFKLCLCFSVTFQLISIISGLETNDEEINSLQAELKLLIKARELIQSQESAEVITLLPYTDPSWKLANLVPKSLVSGNPISASHFLTLKPMPGLLHPSNLGVLVAYTNGVIELREVTGDLLYKLNIGSKVNHIAATNSYDEIKFLCSSDSFVLEIFTVVIEKSMRSIEIDEFGLQTDKVFISIFKEFEVDLGAKPTSLAFFIRSGKKFWVVGDETGSISLLSLSGKKESSKSLSIGPILSIDRFGPQLLVSSLSTTGLINPATFELQQSCSTGGSLISLDALNLTSGVFTLINNKVTLIDTKVVLNNQFTCQGTLYIEIKYLYVDCDKILSTKDYFIAWGSGTVHLFHPVSLELVGSLKVTDDLSGDTGLSYFRTASGGYFLGFSQGSQLHVYEIVLNNKKSLSSEFYNLRYIA